MASHCSVSFQAFCRFSAVITVNLAQLQALRASLHSSATKSDEEGAQEVGTSQIVTCFATGVLLDTRNHKLNHSLVVSARSSSLRQPGSPPPQHNQSTAQLCSCSSMPVGSLDQGERTVKKFAR